jgi:Peptidase family M23
MRGTRRRKTRRTITLIFFLTILGCALTLSAFGWKDMYRHFLEKVPPSITLAHPLNDLGILPQMIEIVFSDTHSGLKYIEIALEQHGKRHLLFRDGALKGAHREHISIDTGGITSFLTEGPCILSLSTRDSSLWRTTITESIPTLVDFTPPKITLVKAITPQKSNHTGFVIFSLSESNENRLTKVGVQSEYGFFSAYPLHFFDRSLPTTTLLYGAVVPFHADTPLSVLVEDGAGNMSSLHVPHTVSSFSYSPKSLEERLTSSEIESIFAKSFHKITTVKSVSPLSLRKPEGKEHLYDLINYLLPLERARIKGLCAPRQITRFWQHAFSPPQGRISEGHHVDPYNSAHQEDVTSSLEGVEVTLPVNESKVRALAPGVVTSVTPLDIYGTVVVVDHGLGVLSVYARLLKSLVPVGEALKEGQLIGEGMVTKDERVSYQYQLRIGHQPIDPQEWFSREWFQETFVNPLVSIREEITKGVR